MKNVLKLFNAALTIAAILFSGASLNAMEQNIPLQSNVNIIIGTIENKLRKPFYINDWTTVAGSARNVYQFNESPKQIFYTKIPFGPGRKPNTEIIKLSCRFPDNDDYWLSLRVHYYKTQNLLEIGLNRESESLAEDATKVLFRQKISVKPHEIIDLLINLILDGENFENSKITVEQTRNSASLRASSIKNVAEMIKAKKITLERAKKILPQDVHEELESYLRK